MQKHLKNKNFYISLICFILGTVFGILVITINVHGKPLSAITLDLSDPSESRSGGHRLINPLYECNSSESYGIRKFKDIEDNLNDYVKEIISSNSVNRVSVYFRDLNSGPWIGINENDEFAPSSLLKLPVLMAYFKKAETNPDILKKKITYTKEPEGLIAQNFQPKNQLVIGNSYTVEELLEKMIQGSDNTSLLLLENSSKITTVTENDIDRVTLDLGLPTANIDTPNNFMSVKDYSTLFRVLYNASYLNNDYSEKALGILSKSEFVNGIVQPIPKDITVSHKFGERHFMNGETQLHDCGIVYYTDHPYLVCIMTKGTYFDDMQQTIQQISEKIYSEIDQRYKEK